MSDDTVVLAEGLDKDGHADAHSKNIACFVLSVTAHAITLACANYISPHSGKSPRSISNVHASSPHNPFDGGSGKIRDGARNPAVDSAFLIGVFKPPRLGPHSPMMVGESRENRVGATLNQCACTGDYDSEARSTNCLRTH